jgi:GNAT superfamily N-acetyltransferase
MWQTFREHHYLNSECLGAGARCYVAKLGDKPVAFIAVAHVHMLVRYFRVSRLVVLPDYQGIGVGKRLLNFVAEHYTSQLPEVPFYLKQAIHNLSAAAWIVGTLNVLATVQQGETTAG